MQTCTTWGLKAVPIFGYHIAVREEWSKTRQDRTRQADAERTAQTKSSFESRPPPAHSSSLSPLCETSVAPYCTPVVR